MLYLSTFSEIKIIMQAGRWMNSETMLIFVILATLVFGPKKIGALDSNPVFNPCSTVGSLKKKDGISLGVGIMEGISSWYNSSDTSLNLLSPCSAELAAQIPATSIVTVFRPFIEQIGLLELTDSSYTHLRNTFVINASLMVFAGGNPTIMSQPRYFLYADGRVPELTLDIHFQEGKLSQLLWKENSCSSCDAITQFCKDGTCVTREVYCQHSDALNSTITDYNCRLMIVFTFSGTDKHNELLTTWYQLANVNRYSLASIFNTLERKIQDGLL